jgi:hypothetical protein
VTHSWTPEEDAAFRATVDGPADWLIGDPMDPTAVSAEPLPTLVGFPFLHAKMGALISGPRGHGRSSLIQAGMYDAAGYGTRCAYLGSEVALDEFDARAKHLAVVRCDEVDDQLRETLARVRYLNLPSVICRAWDDPESWRTGLSGAYDLVAIDPLSSVASALDLDFDKSNADFVRFYDRLVQPVIDDGVTVVLIENIGHDREARHRAKGVSAKEDRADLAFSCKANTDPDALVIRCTKVRSIRAAFHRGDEWIFTRDDQAIKRREFKPGSDSAETFQPTAIMENVSKLLEGKPAGLSKRAVRAAVKGGNEYIDLALELLINGGYVEIRKAGQADHHHSITPYRAVAND